MANRMTRKQIYLDEESDRKLKRVAARLGCTESEVLRKALRDLPEPAMNHREELREKLRQAGILAEPPSDYDVLSREELEATMKRIHEWSRQHPEISLVDALLEDREESDRRLL